MLLVRVKIAGDGQELGALTSWYGQRPEDKPLMIGSVKSNMGHCEGCSGLSGTLLENVPACSFCTCFFEAH